MWQIPNIGNPQCCKSLKSDPLTWAPQCWILIVRSSMSDPQCCSVFYGSSVDMKTYDNDPNWGHLPHIIFCRKSLLSLSLQVLKEEAAVAVRAGSGEITITVTVF